MLANAIKCDYAAHPVHGVVQREQIELPMGIIECSKI